jgi:hypothetical protein
MESELFVRLVSVGADGEPCLCEIFAVESDTADDRTPFEVGHEIVRKFGLVNPGDVTLVIVYRSDFKVVNLHGDDPTVLMTWTITRRPAPAPEPDPGSVPEPDPPPLPPVVVTPADWVPVEPPVEPPADDLPPVFQFPAEKTVPTRFVYAGQLEPLPFPDPDTDPAPAAG